MSKREPREFDIFVIDEGRDVETKHQIRVREVLPDEPDWKALAQELAEALGFYAKSDHLLHVNDSLNERAKANWNEATDPGFVARKAIEKFNKARGEK